MLVSLAAALLVGLAGARFLTPECGEEGCPDLEALRSYRPPEPPRIYDAQGELVGQLSGPRRTVVRLQDVPEIVREGYVAVEDHRFREHDGVDLIGGLRAALRNLRVRGVAEGASTITMQLARNVYGPEVLDWNRFHRKLAEIRVARMIESQLGKDEILELYLNQIYLGDGVYGVETAAQHYFGKPVSEVGTREAALLIGLAQSPEGFNPRRDPAAAQRRIERVLDILVRQGVITAEEAEAARADRVKLSDAPGMPDWGKNAYYLSAVRRELRELFPVPAHRQGLRVYVGLDARAQAAGVDALLSQIRAIEAGRWGTFRHTAAGDSLPRAGVSPYLQGMLVALDAETGLVTSLVGGRDYRHSEFDRAFQARRQAGSAFKPIVYAAALASGLRLSDRISTAPVRLTQQGTPDWEPGDHVSVPELSVRDALVHSSNSAAVRVGERLGVHAVAQQARQMGLTSDIPLYPSVFLGAADVVPVELVAAFAAFGNGGYAIQPHFITRVEDPHGHVVYRRPSSRGQRVLDPRVAFLVLDVMRDVVRRGTGWRALANGLSRPAAGKTGTTNDSRDVWFIGLTPGLVAGVWIGFDAPSTIVRGGAGGTLAAPVWASFMQVASRNRPAEAWAPPPGVVQARLDPRTGYRVSEDCPVGDARTEYFLQGTEPAESCDSWLVDPYAQWPRHGDDSAAVRSQDGRTIFWREDMDSVIERLRRERERYLDSLDALRRAQPGRGDTVVRPQQLPRDTVRSLPPRRDTVWLPPLPRDTVRLPPPPSRDTTRPPGRRDTVAGPGGSGPPRPPPPPPDTSGA